MQIHSNSITFPSEIQIQIQNYLASEPLTFLASSLVNKEWNQNCKNLLSLKWYKVSFFETFVEKKCYKTVLNALTTFGIDENEIVKKCIDKLIVLLLDNYNVELVYRYLTAFNLDEINIFKLSLERFRLKPNFNLFLLIGLLKPANYNSDYFYSTFVVDFGSFSDLPSCDWLKSASQQHITTLYGMLKNIQISQMSFNYAGQLYQIYKKFDELPLLKISIDDHLSSIDTRLLRKLASFPNQEFLADYLTRIVVNRLSLLDPADSEYKCLQLASENPLLALFEFDFSRGNCISEFKTDFPESGFESFGAKSIYQIYKIQHQKGSEKTIKQYLLLALENKRNPRNILEILDLLCKQSCIEKDPFAAQLAIEGMHMLLQTPTMPDLLKKLWPYLDSEYIQNIFDYLVTFQPSNYLLDGISCLTFKAKNKYKDYQDSIIDFIAANLDNLLVSKKDIPSEFQSLIRKIIDQQIKLYNVNQPHHFQLAKFLGEFLVKIEDSLANQECLQAIIKIADEEQDCIRKNYEEILNFQVPNQHFSEDDMFDLIDEAPGSEDSDGYDFQFADEKNFSSVDISDSDGDFE